MEQLATLREGVELLTNEIETDSIATQQIIGRLQHMAVSLKNLEEREKEREKEKEAEKEKEKKKEAEEKAKEDVEKGLRQRIKNVNEDLEKIDESEIQLRKDTNTSLDDIRLRNMMFQSFVSLLFGLIAGLDPQRWWTLFSMIIAMALRSIWVIQKVGFELLRFRKKFTELYKKQNRLYESGEELIMNWKLSKGKDKIGAELKEDYSKLHKSVTMDKIRVEPMGWTNLGNYVFFSLFSIAVPVLLYFVLMAISAKYATSPTHPPSIHCSCP